MKANILAAMRAEDPNMTALEADRTFTLVSTAIQLTIKEFGEARIPGLGTFKKHFREGRVGRNPGTGEQIQIAGKEVLKFKPSKSAFD